MTDLAELKETIAGIAYDLGDQFPDDAAKEIMDLIRPIIAERDRARELAAKLEEELSRHYGDFLPCEDCGRHIEQADIDWIPPEPKRGCIAAHSWLIVHEECPTEAEDE